MSRENATLELLDRKMAELASFVTPAEIFRALLEGTVSGAPRAAVFLQREGTWRGWSSIGYAPLSAQSLRRAVFPANAGWLADVAEEEDVRWRSLLAGETAPQFGQGPAAETVGLPLRVGGKAVAILVAERGSMEQPWSPAALAILCQAARLRLELDLAWRRLKAATGTAAVAAPAVTEAQPPAAPVAAQPMQRPARVGGAATTAATELAPWGGASTGVAEADPRHDEARRFARLVATDIRLYNEEAVVVGRRQRDLAQRLDEQLKRGREAFQHRFPELGADGAKLLDEAYVQVLAGGDASLI